MDLIYITGVSYSGTTLLNLILGTASNSFAVGEAKFLKDFLDENYTDPRIEENGYTCTCGKCLTDCDFWSNALSEVETSKLRGRSFSFGKVFAAQQGNTETVRSEESKLYDNMLNAAQKVEGKNVDYIVESSKSLSRLIYLKSHANINVHVLHLIRDSTSVLHSNYKRGKSPYYSLLLWAAFNAVTSVYLRLFCDGKYLQVKYEKLTKHTRHTVHEINRKFGTNVNTQKVTENISQSVYHLFAGNPVMKESLDSISPRTYDSKDLSLFMICLSTIASAILKSVKAILSITPTNQRLESE